MAWLYVLCAGIIEILWVLGLKYSHTPAMWIGTAALIVLSFFFCIKANEKLPAGSVYAVFTGIGTSGIVLVDIFYFGTPVTLLRILFLLCIVTGVIGVKFITGNNDVEKNHVTENDVEKNSIMENDTKRNHVTENDVEKNRIMENDAEENRIMDNDAEEKHVAENDVEKNHNVEGSCK